MAIFNSKRFKKLAGMLKESSKDSWEGIPTSGYDQNSKESLYSLYSDVYKEKNGFRPHLSLETLEKMSTEDLKAAIDNLEVQPNSNDEFWHGDESDEDIWLKNNREQMDKKYSDALDTLEFEPESNPEDMQGSLDTEDLPLNEPMKRSKIGGHGQRSQSLSGFRHNK